MQQSKNLAIAFLLGAVVVGGALGFSADRMMLRDRIAPKLSGRAKLAAQLDLDSTQRTRLDSILDDRRHRWDLVLAPVQPALDSIKHNAREQIKLMLTPAQREEFERVLAETNATNKTRDDDN